MNRWNPKGLRRNRRGQLLDKWGREMEVDWDEFEKKRLKRPDDYPKWPKVLNPLHAAAGPKRMAESTVNSLLDDPDDFMGRVPFPSQFKVGTRVRVRHTMPDVVTGGQTGVVSELMEPGWVVVDFDAPQMQNNYPFRFMELEVL